MLELKIEAREAFDERRQEFINIKPTTLHLEHSLVSISKWESKWKKPFLSMGEKTQEESLDYVRCMTITQNIDPALYHCLTNDELEQIFAYVEDEKTATTFNAVNTLPNRQVITSELIYYWMCSYNIPFECQKWHLSRLLVLIRIASIHNQPDKKMSKQSILAQNKALNAARRKKFHTKG